MTRRGYTSVLGRTFCSILELCPERVNVSPPCPGQEKSRFAWVLIALLSFSLCSPQDDVERCNAAFLSQLPPELVRNINQTSPQPETTDTKRSDRMDVT